MNTPISTRPLADTAALFSDLIEQGAQGYLDLLTTLGRSDLLSFRGLTTQQKPATQSSCGCHIPPPCWMPQPLGEVVSHVCPGGTATLQLRINNCGDARRIIKLEASGKPLGVKLNPAGLVIGPLEHETATAIVTVPPDAATGQEFELLVWVRGCKTHYLRWKLRVATRGACCCHEVEVNDCPDLVHHWYDHFYCRRPCPAQPQG